MELFSTTGIAARGCWSGCVFGPPQKTFLGEGGRESSVDAYVYHQVQSYSSTSKKKKKKFRLKIDLSEVHLFLVGAVSRFFMRWR